VAVIRVTWIGARWHKHRVQKSLDGALPAGRQSASGSTGRQRRNALLLLVFVAQPIYKHLLDRFIVGHQDVANRMAANEMADFLS
jgi:hypothetical protein